jgi:hypothetical protein
MQDSEGAEFEQPVERVGEKAPEVYTEEKRQQGVTDAVKQLYGAYIADIPGTPDEFAQRNTIIDGLAAIWSSREPDTALLIPEPRTISEDELTNQSLRLNLRDWVYRRALRAVDDYVKAHKEQESQFEPIEAAALYKLIEKQQTLAKKKFETWGENRIWSPTPRDQEELLRTDEDVVAEVEERDFIELQPWDQEGGKQEHPFGDPELEFVYYALPGKKKDKTNVRRAGNAKPSRNIAIIKKKENAHNMRAYASKDGKQVFIHGRGDAVMRAFIHDDADQEDSWGYIKNSDVDDNPVTSIEMTGLGIDDIQETDVNVILDDVEVGELVINGDKGDVSVKNSKISYLLIGNHDQVRPPSVALENSDINTGYVRVSEPMFANDVDFYELTVKGGVCNLVGDVSQLNIKDGGRAFVDGKCNGVKAEGRGFIAVVSEDVAEIDPESAKLVTAGKPMRAAS